ncbi:MAG: bifunctional heptose 7-phosphate kinase/heptose 1-phosphate adenyltransferase [Flavobacteriales bacterium]
MNPLEALGTTGNLHVMVVGDVMVDAYLIGKVNRISPEAPVPVVEVTARESRLGGAANVARNVIALGASVELASVIGNDEPGAELIRKCQAQSIGTDAILVDSNRPTTIKNRIISDGQHLLRVDEEVNVPLTDSAAQSLIQSCLQRFEQQPPDVVIFEDYDKGVLTPLVIETLVDAANDRGIPTCVDPKFRQFSAYRNVSLFKPNLKELREGLGLNGLNHHDDDELKQASEQLQETLRCSCVLVTLSERGVWALDGHGHHHHLPAHPREINDVSGAGDTVIATASLLLAAGVHFKDCAAVANLAGGLVCEKVGVVPIELERLKAEVLQMQLASS